MSFRKYLMERDCSENTIRSYEYAVKQLFNYISDELPAELKNLDIDRTVLTQENLSAYRSYLINHYKVATVNQRINAVNSFLRYGGICLNYLKPVKTSNVAYVDNVITDAEYERLKEGLSENNNLQAYFIVKYLAATGVRVSELVKFTTGDVDRGYVDIKSKGNKIRRVYIPSVLVYETNKYFLQDIGSIRPLFCSRCGNALTPGGVRYILKQAAEQFDVPKEHVHPHAFRHRFALNFMRAQKDISMLSDLLGHESIETTRIYLRKSADEQKEIIDRIVNW